MNHAKAWLGGLLIAIVLSSSYLLDGPTEQQAAELTAQVVADVEAEVAASRGAYDNR